MIGELTVENQAVFGSHVVPLQGYGSLLAPALRLGPPLKMRAACLGNFESIARSAGIDPFQMLEASGIHVSALNNPDALINSDAVLHLLDASARVSGLPDFGLRMAENWRLSDLGPISLAIRQETSPRKALECALRYLRLHHQGMLLRLDDIGGLSVIHCGVLTSSFAPQRQGIELMVAAVVAVVRQLHGPVWKPECICFSHSRLVSLDRYTKIFGCDVEFEQEFDGIMCRVRDLDYSKPERSSSGNTAVHRQLAAMLAYADEDMVNEDIVNKVKKLAITLLPEGRCTADAIADHFGVDRRTVSRYLAMQGETFSTVVDAVRATLCLRYLQSSSRSLSEIAELLGFSALSAFSRWFREKFGCSPRAWKEQEHASASDTLQKMPNALLTCEMAPKR